jgi:hypothetical protein
MERPVMAPAPGRELLTGGAAITEFVLKRKVDKEDVRWLYGQLPNFAGVIWRLKEDGALLSWTDELTEYLETKAAEAKASALATASTKIAEKEALAEAARKAAQPAPARSRKPPARVATQRRDRRTRQPESVS